MRACFALLVLVTTTIPGFAQVVTSPDAGTATPYSGNGSAVQKLLVDGYEIKTSFSDNGGGAYMVLQKSTSAYLCHSSPNQTCEKLN